MMEGDRKLDQKFLDSLDFKGTFECLLDDKWRLIMPTAFRNVIEKKYKEKAIVLTIIPGDKALSVFSSIFWDSVAEKLLSESDIRKVAESVVGVAQRCEYDKQGRIVIPKLLRGQIDLTINNKIVLVGLLDRFKIWSKQGWEDQNKEAKKQMEDPEIASKIEKVLNSTTPTQLSQVV